MPRHTTKLAVALLTLAVCVLLGLPFTFLFPASLSQQSACWEWEKSDVAVQGLGWDLTYRSVLDKAGICPDTPLCEQWAKPPPPIHKHFAEWQGDPIVSSMEIEMFDGHAGMWMIWLIRTKNDGYAWLFHSSDFDNVRRKESISTRLYDQAFQELSCWRQEKPRINTFWRGGYGGLLSLYKAGRFRQLLLTYNDLFEENSFVFFEEKGDPERLIPGRFSILMGPLLSPISEE